MQTGKNARKKSFFGEKTRKTREKRLRKVKIENFLENYLEVCKKTAYICKLNIGSLSLVVGNPRGTEAPARHAGEQRQSRWTKESSKFLINVFKYMFYE
jgi:hypothetical protein